MIEDRLKELIKLSSRAAERGDILDIQMRSDKGPLIHGQRVERGNRNFGGPDPAIDGTFVINAGGGGPGA